MRRVKGIVFTVSNNQATILTDQGEFKQVRVHGFIQPGEIWQSSSVPIWKYACAAAVLLFLVAGGVDFLSVTAYARVSSNVELGLNRWDRVISVKALNNDSKQVLENLDLKGKKVKAAVEELTKNNMTNFSEEKPVIIMVSNNSDNEEIKERIEKEINVKVQGVDKKQHYKTKVKPQVKTQVKTKTNKNNGSLDSPVQSSPEKSYMNNEEQDNNQDNDQDDDYNNTEPVKINNGNIKTTLPPKNNNGNKIGNNENNSFIKMFRFASFNNSIVFGKNIFKNNNGNNQ